MMSPRRSTMPITIVFLSQCEPVALTPHLAADERLIDFNVPAKRRIAVNVRHVRADQMRHAERGRVADAQLPLQFLRGHAVARRCEEVDRIEPLHERRVAVREDRALHRVDVMAAIAGVSGCLVSFRNLPISPHFGHGKNDGTPQRRAIGAGAGAASEASLIAAIVSFCCAGPWAVMLLGVPGAIFLARWAPYRPYLIVASGALLAWSLWRTYRLRQDCAAGRCASGPSPLLIGSLSAASALWLFALVAPYIADLIARSTLPQGGV